MKLSHTLLAASALSLIAAGAQAQDGQAYINVGVDAFEFDAYTLSGKVGYNFNDYLGLEGQASIGIGDDDATFDEIFEGTRVQGSATAGIDTSFAAFGRFKFPVTDRVEVFARGGYHFTQAGFEVSDITVTADGTPQVISAQEDNLDFDGFAVGAGAQFMFNELNGFRLEYTFLDINEIEGVDVNDIDDDIDFGTLGSDVYSISYVRRF